MDIFIMQHNYHSEYLVVIDGGVYDYIYEKYEFDKPFLSFKPKRFFIVKSKVCDMTEFSGAAVNSSDFDGITLLLEVEDRKYVYISGLEITEFRTDDKILGYISLMGNNMIPYAIMLAEKYTYSLHHRYIFIENDKIQEGTLLNATNTSLDPYNYHLKKCSVDSFKKLQHLLIHTFWPGHGEDIEKEDDISDVEDEVEEDGDLIETSYTNGTNEMVKIFNQNCVICLERDSDYAFRQCGHHCICEQRYQNKGDIDLLKCVVCRT